MIKDKVTKDVEGRRRESQLSSKKKGRKGKEGELDNGRAFNFLYLQDKHASPFPRVSFTPNGG